LADRYIYTACARDLVRGWDPRWVREVYGFAIKPHITFYFGVSVEEASERILAGRHKLNYYEAEMDLNLSNGPYKSCRIFQSRIIEQYEYMAESEGFVTLNASAGIEEQQYLARKKSWKRFQGVDR
jgi:dTMP kinase